MEKFCERRKEGSFRLCLSVLCVLLLLTATVGAMRPLKTADSPAPHIHSSSEDYPLAADSLGAERNEHIPQPPPPHIHSSSEDYPTELQRPNPHETAMRPLKTADSPPPHIHSSTEDYPLAADSLGAERNEHIPQPPPPHIHSSSEEYPTELQRPNPHETAMRPLKTANSPPPHIHSSSEDYPTEPQRPNPHETAMRPLKTADSPPPHIHSSSEDYPLAADSLGAERSEHIPQPPPPHIHSSSEDYPTKPQRPNPHETRD